MANPDICNSNQKESTQGIKPKDNIVPGKPLTYDDVMEMFRERLESIRLESIQK